LGVGEATLRIARAQLLGRQACMGGHSVGQGEQVTHETNLQGVLAVSLWRMALTSSAQVYALTAWGHAQLDNVEF
jgi:hypothetical protein